MQVVVLAAGTGSRLKGLTESIPKALVELNGKPLLAYALAFAREVGGDDIVVVVGAHAEKVIEFLQATGMPEVRWVENEDFLVGNLYSLGAARGELAGDFLLMNTDHVYHRDIATKVRKQCVDLTAFCDQDRQLGADDMKVALDGNGCLEAISKQLERYDRGYVGMTYCPANRLGVYFEAFDRVASEVGDPAVVEMVLGKLAQGDAKPQVGDISGVGWLEIDTPEERDAAMRAVRAHPENYPAVELPK